MRSTRPLLTSFVVAIPAAIGMGVVTAPAAQEATVGYFYMSFPNWLGNCAEGGRTTIIWASDGFQAWNADAGDDLIYGKVWLNQSIHSLLQWCYQPGYSTSLVPTRNNQTTWVGPGEWTRN